MTLEMSKVLFYKQIEEICKQMDGIQKHESFPRWMCPHILRMVDKGMIDDAVSIGIRGDYGADLFYSEEDGDMTEKCVCYILAKFSEDLDHLVTLQEIKSLVGTIRYLKKYPDPANMTFKQKSVAFVEVENKNSGVQQSLLKLGYGGVLH